MTQRAMNMGLGSQLKKILAKRGEIIYGSSMFGQVHEKDMNAQDAAMWLAPRLSQLRNESGHWQKCLDLLKRSRRAPEDVANVDLFSTSIRNKTRVVKAHEGVGVFFNR